MAFDGIWTSEILGLFGWETTGIVVLDDGRAIDGGNHHYSSGCYQATGNKVKISLTVEYHGTPRTIFGSADKKLFVEINGKLRGDIIVGSAYRLDKSDQKITIKLTRRADLPPRVET
ncbi:MAG: hypothetical protein U5R46_19015 [Gammaproteobacteria bacterium]|nr:hypothetical protein [Gammaproteobacteria bacterium]